MSKDTQKHLGTVIQILGCTVIALSRTRQTLALSSGEAELYAIGASILESLHSRSFVLETGFAKTCPILVHTDSSAAKSMATRFGTTRRTRHIDFRFLYLQHLVTHRQNSGRPKQFICTYKVRHGRHSSKTLRKLGLACAKEYWDGMD